MKRDPRLYLEDIRESVIKIKRYTQGLSFEEFRNSEMVVDAVIRNFEIIGEAASQTPDSIKEKHSDVPWYKMKGLRNVIAHEYFGVRLITIWETIQNDLPTLESQIEKTLAELMHKK